MTETFSLQDLNRGVRIGPRRSVIYGVEGVGKSTFGADAPAPVFMGIEDGSGAFPNIARFPAVSSWAGILAGVDMLITQASEFKTFVLDSLDWAEPLCHRAVADRFRVANIEAVGGGYGKGYVAAVDEWRVLLRMLDELRARRQMQIILIAHSVCKTTKQPDMPDFDRYTMAINQKAADLIKQWCDLVLFARWETYTTEDERGRVKGASSGCRIVHTQWRPAFDAKSRVPIPAKLPLQYAAVADAIEHGIAVADVKAQIEALAKVAPPDIARNILGAMATAGDDSGRLLKILDRGRVVVNEAKEEKGDD